MPWFKVDDNLAFHHKVIAAGNPAMGLWVRAGSACAQQLTDGFIPAHMATALGTKAQAERLVSAGLWERAEGGYKFHEWAARQPSKASVEAERAVHSERMRVYRERKKTGKQTTSAQVSGSRDGARTGNEQRTNNARAGVPSRPVPTVLPTEVPIGGAVSGKPQVRATRRPEGFAPNEKHKSLANELGIDLRSEWDQFCDHHDAKGSTMKDWDAALRTWIRNAKKFNRGQPAQQASRSDQWLALGQRLHEEEAR